MVENYKYNNFKDTLFFSVVEQFFSILKPSPNFDKYAHFI